jgi:hypothetical protein
MDQLKSSYRRLTSPVSIAAALLLAPGLIASLGCAQPESSNWAQTSPLIEPEKRVEASYHLSAHADVAKAEVDELDVDEPHADAGLK